MLFYGTLMCICTFSCYRYFRENRYTVSPKVLSLFKMLMNILVLELLLGFLIGGTMTAIAAISFMTQFRSGSLILLIVLTVTELYPLCSHLIVLTFIEPYRQGLFRILHLKRFIKPSNTNQPRINT
jgi:hypothetical protein